MLEYDHQWQVNTMNVLQQATAQTINESMGDMTGVSVAFKQDSDGLRAFQRAIV